MPTTTRRTVPRAREGGTRRTRPTAADPDGRAAARRGGLLASVALAASCGITTLLLAAGVAAGAGLAGSVELTIAAVAVPVTLLAWPVLQRARRRMRATKDPL